MMVLEEIRQNVRIVPVMRAPRWKLMICIGLERFFELPIIPAPKRNSKLHNGMWTNPSFTEGFLGAVRVRDASRGFDERHACAQLFERRPPGQELIEQYAQRIEIAASIDPKRVHLRLFRTHVFEGSHSAPYWVKRVRSVSRCSFALTTPKSITFGHRPVVVHRHQDV